VQHRWFVSIMSMSLLACAGPAQVREPSARPRVAANSEERAEAPGPSRKSSAASARKPKPKPQGARDAKAAYSSEGEEASGAEAFAGVDVSPPVDPVIDQPERAVAIKGIEGTMSEYDVRTTLEGRDPEFDRCHDEHRGGSGRIEFRIHILASGEVGDVKVHSSRVRNRELIDCYTEVVSASRFTAPHGGYADVTWRTKVGRSRKRPDALFERKVRWDAPSSSASSRPIPRASEERTERAESSDSRRESRRERRRARRHRRGV
jgi:hypothetical protein